MDSRTASAAGCKKVGLGEARRGHGLAYPGERPATLPSRSVFLVPGFLWCGDVKACSCLGLSAAVLACNALLPGRPGTHVAPESGTRKSGLWQHLLEKSVSHWGLAAAFLIWAFWGSKSGWGSTPPRLQGTWRLSSPSFASVISQRWSVD